MPKITLPKNLDKVINAGGSVPAQTEEKQNKTARVTLYLPDALKKKIESSRISKYKKETMNSWIIDAVILKLKYG